MSNEIVELLSTVMECPYCHRLIPDELILSQAAAVLGRRGRGNAKARDPSKMSAAGKKGGGWPKGKKRK